MFIGPININVLSIFDIFQITLDYYRYYERLRYNMQYFLGTQLNRILRLSFVLNKFK